MTDDRERAISEMHQEGEHLAAGPGVVGTKRQTRGFLGGALAGTLVGALIGLVVGLILFDGLVGVVASVVAFAVALSVAAGFIGGFTKPRKEIPGTGADK